MQRAARWVVFPILAWAGILAVVLSCRLFGLRLGHVHTSPLDPSVVVLQIPYPAVYCVVVLLI